MEKTKHYYVAITGTAGSGKSTVLQILKDNGYFTIDYDYFSHQVINDSKSVHSRLSKIIGKDFNNFTEKDLKYIGSYFELHQSDEKRFEEWFQPYIGKKIKNQFHELKYSGLCFFDIPFLTQRNLESIFNEIWIISAEKEKCITRILKRNKYTKEKAQYLIDRSEIKNEIYKINYSIIDNNCSINNLKKKILYQGEIALTRYNHLIES